MERWVIFLKERMPVPVLLILSLGIALSSLASAPLPSSKLLLALALLMPALFFLVLRFMDEVKDFEKDKIAHPERPLPRGLLSPQEVTRVIYGGLFVMVLLGGGLYALGHGLAGAVYLFTTLYLWLMYKEFFIGHALEKSPFLYALTHQVIILFLTASIRCFDQTILSWEQFFIPGLMIMGAFFTYEICRKLDPEAHPVLKTYRSQYGHKKTLGLILLTSLMALLGDALALGVNGASFYSLGLLVVAVPFAYLKFLDYNYKLIEGLATISLILHIWWLFGRYLVGA